MKNLPSQRFSRALFRYRLSSRPVNVYTDVLSANILNTTIVASVVAIVLKLLVEGLFVAAGGLLLPLAFLAYLTFTDAWLMQ
ncbi:hypothetical protein SAMN05443636_2410 [Halobaculum gomorrense]|uniref:Uncharacterized protein n=1 Tax=Halobaculum gomorrense TaxID=43928 RepID=A0A1M5SDJ8_9EURY|nr:hypothetical protein SAMN05443636_2410 [Halobaculum gomorrense]